MNDSTVLPAYVVAAQTRPHLDERLNDLIGDYKACGMGMVVVVINQYPDEENEGRVIYDGGVHSTTEMAVNALGYASRCILQIEAEYVAEGKERITADQEVGE